MVDKELTGYNLSRAFWDYSFENPDKVKPLHVSIFFFAIEHCNRLGWKEKFGFPTGMAMEAIGIKSYASYKRGFDDLAEWGFIKVIEYSKNQYSSNIIALSKNNKANVKALDKATSKHRRKQRQSTHQSTGESTGESTDSIIKPLTINQEPLTISSPPAAQAGPKRKKKVVEKDSEPYWAQLVQVWFDFNIEKFLKKNPGSDPKEGEPSFSGADPRSLLGIVQGLRKRAEIKGVEWTEETSKLRLHAFLESCWKDSWLQGNFLLSNLKKQFDKIILNHGHQHEQAGKNNTHRPVITGAAAGAGTL